MPFLSLTLPDDSDKKTNVNSALSLQQAPIRSGERLTGNARAKTREYGFKPVTINLKMKRINVIFRSAFSRANSRRVIHGKALCSKGFLIENL